MTTRSEPGGDRPDPGLTAIISERRQLINLAYRLLGSLAEAEDAVQETYARWYAMSRQQQEAIESPGAWLTTVASRICLNLLGSARARRETYVGEWIPEPLPEPRERITGRPAGPPPRPGRSGHPRRVGQHGLPRRARVDDPGRARRPDPARRLPLLLRRGRRDRRPHPGRLPPASLVGPPSAVGVALAPPPPTAKQAGVIRAFKQAWEAKDINALIGLLDPDATATADGGGLALTFLHPIEGAEQIARAWIEIANRVTGNAAFLERTVNGQPGLVVQQDGVVVSVFAFDVAGDRIRHIWVVRNPEKLRPWTAP